MEEKKYKITFKNRTVTWVDQDFMNCLRDLILFDHEKKEL